MKIIEPTGQIMNLRETGMNRLWCLLTVFFAVSSSAQTNDFGAWTGFSLEYEKNKFTFVAEAESRFTNNVSECEKLFVEPSISYELFPFLSVDASIRYSSSFEVGENHQNSVRYSGGFELSKKYEAVKLSLRSKLQRDVDRLLLFEDKWRNKLGLKYFFNGSPFRIGMSGEVFLPISEPRSRINKLRSAAYIEYFFTADLKLKSQYIYQTEIHAANPEHDHIVGLSLVYSL